MGVLVVGARILVVDDDADLRTLACQRLTVDGYTVVTAATGGEALDVLATGPADLILMDVTMPGMTGVETVAALRRAHPRIPVLMVTAVTGDAAVESAFRAGADEYLYKPYSPREMSARVGALLARP